MKKHNIIIDKNERLVFSLKNGNLQNIISGEGVKNETALITDKRLYYSNKTGIVNIVSHEEKVDLEDIHELERWIENCMRDGYAKAQEIATEKMKPLMGGLGNLGF